MDVVLVRWPEEDARLQQLRADGAPRLLLLNGESAPPDLTDCLEDWIRLPLQIPLIWCALQSGRHRDPPR